MIFIGIFFMIKRSCRLFWVVMQQPSIRLILMGCWIFFEKKLFCYGIELKENHECIGIIFENERHDETIEIGYALSSAYWNLGYMSEALAAVLKELMEEEKGHVFSAAAFKENVGSWRVMEKCGMKYSHTVKDEIEWQGKSHDVVYYEIKKGDK